jgi:exopolysaccharide production protein ExoZ
MVSRIGKLHSSQRLPSEMTRNIPTPPPHFQLHTSLPLPSKIQQIDGLQVLRAFAVSQVAWAHAGLELAPYTRETLLDFRVFGIDVFFVISGFIMASILLRTGSKPGPAAAWAFLKRRLIRIFPIYWLFALLNAARILHSHQSLGISHLPAFLLLPLPQYPPLVDFSWTMMFEMFFYYTLCVVLLFTVRRAVPTTIALLCAAVTLGAFTGTHTSFWVVITNPMLLEFIFGAVIALAHKKFAPNRPLGIAALVSGFAAALYFQYFPPNCATGMQMVLAGDRVTTRAATWGLAAALMVFGVAFWLPAMKSRIGRVAVILGNASYSTYLLSALAIEYVLRLLLHLRIASLPLTFTAHILYQTVVLAAVLCTGWLCYQIVEWPLVRTLQAKFR